MRGFEQGTSNARCIIIQFHRPAELKLKRNRDRKCFPVCLPDIRDFFGFIESTAFYETKCSAGVSQRGKAAAAEKNMPQAGNSAAQDSVLKTKAR